jgi:hypothetical protein
MYLHRNIILLTAFVLRMTRIYYFDYTVNARPNACTLWVARPWTVLDRCEIRARARAGTMGRMGAASRGPETIRTSDK